MNAATQPVNATFPGSQTRQLDYHNWIHLNPGDKVIVKQPASPPEHGTVDDIAEDASYFWVWIDGHSRNDRPRSTAPATAR
jgi:protein involved in polysaccharide export with SLBB domain